MNDKIMEIIIELYFVFIYFRSFFLHLTSPPVSSIPIFISYFVQSGMQLNLFYF